MKLKVRRRTFLRLTAGAATLPVLSAIARAENYPTRPVHLVNGFAAGGIIDVEARIIGQRLSERLGQPFIVDDRPGAATNIATEFVVHAPPDGYTLLWVTTANAINATVYPKLNFDFLRDIEPIASLDRFPLVMEVNPSVPAKTVPEFIAYAKANPGKINFASGGIGSIQHVAGELFKYMTGVNLVHVPYRGAAPVLSDLLAGQVQLTFSPIGSSLSYIQAGKLRALAVTTPQRTQILPDVPAVAEFVPGYAATASDGLGAPKGTPPAIIDRLHKEVNAATADPEIKARLARLGSEPVQMTPGEFKAFLTEETEKWAKVVKFAGIKPE